MQNQQNLNVSLKDTTPVLCEECEGEVFNQVVLLKKVSKFLTGTPDDAIIPMYVFACAKCGHVNKEFLPKE